MHEFIKSVEPVKNWNKSEKNIVKGYASFTAAAKHICPTGCTNQV